MKIVIYGMIMKGLKCDERMHNEGLGSGEEW